ncbi:MAG: hypothetical protein A3J74_02570 [Elusimicrobia bacterium RIFCSPHIGHO2_02_FULL_57_9]|nr:MAG: hypothetical protein A3J74_02570 [Elusimicrobia bacterium RIFCSPHIGHO2_02_FULL_57_9]
MKDWWKRFFRSSVFPIADLVDSFATKQEVAAVAKILKLPRNSRLLDVACGTGRHSIGLARRGFQVRGVDYSSSYLAEARRRAGRVANVRFLRRDMRFMGFSGEFDAVVNLWTSFGYFPSLADDRRALRAMFRALKPGGKFLIELVDGSWFEKNKPVFRHWHRSGKFWALEETHLRKGKDAALLAERIYIGPKGKTSRGHSFVRMYSLQRLAKEVRTAGFKIVKIGPGLIPWRLKQDGPGRFYILARRPGTFRAES